MPVSEFAVQNDPILFFETTITTPYGIGLGHY